uniref:HD domain-containing protein n=1 Tax=Paramoeba aestuarina TaxID=180227 RepID=A0A7S4P530_9EUKA|mmetsp:Transcript_36269/g.56836  ORF Transcript_36269/g.56836 Transcript_36269/m.56836 type:complete len:496 (+) Transcript_36269:590-2077(+)
MGREEETTATLLSLEEGWVFGSMGEKNHKENQKEKERKKEKMSLNYNRGGNESILGFPSSPTIINDIIHGYIELPRQLLQIVDTPQFQRLRELHQLGCTYMVFPGGRHSRFEHCVGVGYLAGRMLRGIQERQPELEVTEREVQLVQVAGLCHDLGHGPFSHAFESWVRNIPEKRDFHHEDMSVKVFKYMIDDNAIDFLEKEDINFVCELISGTPTGARKEKRFLYDIVANSRNSVDVDKFDYLSRDAYHLKIAGFDPARLLLNCRVIDDEICFHSKSYFQLFDMFHSRFSLWKQVYSHRVTKCIEYMIGDMYSAADPVLKISEAAENVEDYCNLTDSIVRFIEMSKDPDLQGARDIVKKIRKRQLYKTVDAVIYPTGDNNNKICLPNYDDFSEESLLKHKERSLPSLSLSSNDIILQKLRVNYGMRDQNPLDFIHFFHSGEPNVKTKLTNQEVAQIQPAIFEEKLVRLFVRDKDNITDAQKLWTHYLENSPSSSS